MSDCLPICCVPIVYIYIYHVNKFEARLLFLYLQLKNCGFNLIRSVGASKLLKPPPPQHFALTHIILELQYFALGLFQKI